MEKKIGKDGSCTYNAIANKPHGHVHSIRIGETVCYGRIILNILSLLGCLNEYPATDIV